MKRLSILIVFVVAALAAASAVQAQMPPVVNFTLDLNFDGFCDGWLVSSAGANVTGVWDCSCCSCPMTNVVHGIWGKVDNGLKGVSGFTTPPIAEGFVDLTHVFQDGTWFHYDTFGTVVISGTWSFCPEEMQFGPASFQ